MRTVVPSTKLHPATARLLDEHLPSAEIVELNPDLPDDYCRFLTVLWESGEDFLIVEHDIGVHDEVVPQFTDCPSWWCGFRYRVGDVYLAALGCTRFRAELLQAEPDLMAVVSRVDTGGLPAGDWRRLDVRIMDELHVRHYTRCEHVPEVKHFHYEGE